MSASGYFIIPINLRRLSQRFFPLFVHPLPTASRKQARFLRNRIAGLENHDFGGTNGTDH
jgi:hypothetical protein